MTTHLSTHQRTPTAPRKPQAAKRACKHAHMSNKRQPAFQLIETLYLHETRRPPTQNFTVPATKIALRDRGYPAPTAMNAGTPRPHIKRMRTRRGLQARPDSTARAGEQSCKESFGPLGGDRSEKSNHKCDLRPPGDHVHERRMRSAGASERSRHLQKAVNGDLRRPQNDSMPSESAMKHTLGL